MTYFSKTDTAKLFENGKAENQGKDHFPLVRFYLNGTGGSLLITEIRSEKPLIAYGLCDLSHDLPKPGLIDLSKIANYLASSGGEMKRDPHFKAKYPLSAYVNFAKRRRLISGVRSILNNSTSSHE